MTDMQRRWGKLAICFAFGAILWFVPPPMGMEIRAWHLLGLFLATIISFILQPFSIGVMTFITVTMTALLGVLKPGEALSGYSSGTVWLILSAFLFSRGFIKTGLGRRIAFSAMSKFGGSALKLGYALCFSNFIISPAIPSNTARGGGIMFPIVKSLAEAMDSKPGPTARKIGAFLIQAVCQSDNIACCVMMTAVSSNFLIANMAANVAGIEFTWGSWFLAAIVPGLIALLLIPYILYRVYPPEMKDTSQAKILAGTYLHDMGPMSFQEKLLCSIFIIAILGWATSSITGLNATIIAMAAVCVMLITNVITWDDVKSEKSAWDTLAWMGGIFGLADTLGKMGAVKVLAEGVGVYLTGVHWLPALIVLFAVYILTTYCFASGVAHTAAVYPAALAVAISVGAPPYLAALMLAYGQGFSQSMTHYSSGPTAVFFSGGYVPQSTWWKLGGLIVAVNIAIWSVIGSAWWKIIGLW